jgi:putative addiction module component (TIGR02574 family)
MTATLVSLGIDRMSRDERIELALAIWDSVSAEEAAPRLSEARRRELDRRIAEDDADSEGCGTTWEEAEGIRRSRTAS